MMTKRGSISVALMASLLVVPALSQDNGRSFSVSKGGTLEVSLSGGSIEVLTWERNSVEIVNPPREDDLQGWSVEHQGANVRISDDGEYGRGSDRLTVRAPVDYNLKLETASGNIQVKGTLGGNLHAETSGGNIAAERIRGNGELATSGGNVRVADAEGELQISTSGGELHVGNVAKNLEASTAGGNIIVGNVGGEAEVTTAGGNIKAGRLSQTARLTTAGGNIEIDGGAGRIQLTTAGGDLTAHEIRGSLDATTAGGNVEATLIPAVNGQSQLVSAGGRLRLFLPADARATIDADIQVFGGRDDDEEYEIRSDFPAEQSGRTDRRDRLHRRFLLNGGGARIRLETVNSDIEIRKIAR